MRAMIILHWIFLAVLFGATTATENGFCSWKPSTRDFRCRNDQFQCLDGYCIRRDGYCNGYNECNDRSDELYCNNNYNRCPTERAFVKCRYSEKCIPEKFICDGFTDCPNADDESNCTFANQKVRVRQSLWNVTRWLHSQRAYRATKKWGSSVDKSAVLHFFTRLNLTGFMLNKTSEEMAYEVSIKLFSRLSSMKLQDIPSSDLASIINSFMVMCLDPRRFQGLDLVQELRNRVERQNYTNPYVFLTLCNAGDTITESDTANLNRTFWTEQRPFWTGTQALVVMALACARKQPGSKVELQDLKQLTMELKERQYRNGSVENLQTTALVMQALLASETDKDADHFDEIKALDQILQSQTSDGSFGDPMNTYFVTPILTCRSLVDINSDHCQNAPIDENTALDDLINQRGPKIRVRYSLWIGEQKDLERHVVLRVPKDMSLYRTMEIASKIDHRYKFEYTVKNKKPYINALSGFRDDPETEKYWFLYTIQNGQPVPSSESPAEIIPKENEHYVMWYRRGTWMD